ARASRKARRRNPPTRAWPSPRSAMRPRSRRSPKGRRPPRRTSPRRPTRARRRPPDRRGPRAASLDETAENPPMSAATLLPTLAVLVLFVLLFALVARVVGGTSGSLSGMFKAGELRWPSGVQEEDDLRWSWKTPRWRRPDVPQVTDLDDATSDGPPIAPLEP